MLSSCQNILRQNIFSLGEKIKAVDHNVSICEDNNYDVFLYLCTLEVYANIYL